MMRNDCKLRTCFTVAAALALLAPASQAQVVAPGSFQELGESYTARVRPLLARYCLGCHSAEDKEGDLDLESLADLDSIRRASGVWKKVVEMIDDGQMPPQDSRQPTPPERAAVREWVGRYLQAEARVDAGDPGPVVLRRLNNAQYAYTLRDLTGYDYHPERDFPHDGAAGEGFTNAGEALVMSPALLGKYLDAAKRVAAHAVLLPDGFRFSPSETPRDWTEELLAAIRELYARHADAEGRIALDKYLAAALEGRKTAGSGEPKFQEIADRHSLNARYLEAISKLLTAGEPSPLLDPLRAKWKTARPEDVPALAAEIAGWQQALTKVQAVGHMKPRIADVDPVVVHQPLSFKFPEAATGPEAVVHLTATGGDGDVVVWENLRLVRPGRPDVPLQDVRGIAEGLAERRAQVAESASRALAAASDALANPTAVDREGLAKRHDVDPAILGAWFDCLGIGSPSKGKLDLFTERMLKVGGFDAAAGWGTSETPLVVANASEETLRIPGELKGRGVAVHPSAALRAVSAWSCPTAGDYRIEAQVQHAHPACGNGVVWRLELRRGTVRLALGEGPTAGGAPIKAGPFGSLALTPGDLIALSIGARNGNHSCDLTAVDLTLTDATGRAWDLAREVTADGSASNPHADAFGNADVWKFFREPDSAASGLAVPVGSLLARWLEAKNRAERTEIAVQVQHLLTTSAAGASKVDAALFRDLNMPGGPLIPAVPATKPVVDSPWGVDPARFGPSALAADLPPSALAVETPAVVTIRLPIDLAAGAELAGSAIVRPSGGKGIGGFVQVRATAEVPAPASGPRPDAPFLVADEEALGRLKKATAEFREWFPPTFCYAKIVPADEAVTLALFHREDEPLRRLLLDDAERARLDRLWDELHFVSQDAIGQVDAFNQLMEYATQDGDPRLFEPFRQPILADADAFRKTLAEAEPRHVDRLVEFAASAYRRPTDAKERRELRDLYTRLRAEEIPHDEAFRLTLARILTSPAFLYRLEKQPTGVKSAPVSDWELANRLSFFLRSSAPDSELREAAASGRLRDPDVLAAQARRLLKAPDVRRLAEEFACQWLHIYGFDALDEKSHRHFPTFAKVKGAMYEEAIRFFTDFFQADAPLLSIYDADHAFVNEDLAEHYGIPDVKGPEWRRIDGVRKYGRGGILGLSATLAKESGASRTSPILRGNWVTEVLLGERTPKPPKDVPVLPDDEEAAGGLSVRQLVEKHTQDVRCAGCHAKMDPYGFSLEAYDAVGRFRDHDVSGHAIDAQARLLDGSEFVGADGLRTYLSTKRREAVERQFCRKLLGYALGRSLLLTDEPLLDEILQAKDHRIATIVETIVRSRQFQEIRGDSTAVAGTDRLNPSSLNVEATHDQP